MKSKKKKTKEIYEKPKLRVIELNVEEVLGVGCKTTSSGQAISAIPCFPGNNCLAAGS